MTVLGISLKTILVDKMLPPLPSSLYLCSNSNDPFLWFFSSLWVNSDEHLELTIPDTVILQHGSPTLWLFTARDQKIRRHLSNKVSLPAIRDSFLTSSQKLFPSSSPSSPFVRFFTSDKPTTLTKAEFRARILNQDPHNPLPIRCCFQLNVLDFTFSSYSFSITYSLAVSEEDRFQSEVNQSINNHPQIVDVISPYFKTAITSSKKLIDWLQTVNQCEIKFIKFLFCLTQCKTLYLLYPSDVVLNKGSFSPVEIPGSPLIKPKLGDVQTELKTREKKVTCKLGLCCQSDLIDSELFNSFQTNSEQQTSSFERFLVESARMYYRKTDPYLINARLSRIPATIYRDLLRVCSHCGVLVRVYDSKFRKEISLSKLENLNSDRKMSTVSPKLSQDSNLLTSTISADKRKSLTLSRIDELRNVSVSVLEKRAPGGQTENFDSLTTCLELENFSLKFPLFSTIPTFHWNKFFNQITINSSTVNFSIFKAQPPKFRIVFFTSLFYDIPTTNSFFHNLSIVSPVEVVAIGLPGHVGTDFPSIDLDNSFLADVGIEALQELIKQNIVEDFLFKKDLPLLIMYGGEACPLALSIATLLSQRGLALNLVGFIGISPLIPNNVLLEKLQSALFANVDSHLNSSFTLDFFSNDYLARSRSTHLVAEYFNSLPFSPCHYHSQLSGLQKSVDSSFSNVINKVKEMRLLRLLPTLIIQGQSGLFQPCINSTVSLLTQLAGGSSFVCSDPANLFVVRLDKFISRVCLENLDSGMFLLEESSTEVVSLVTAFAFNVLKYLSRKSSTV
ncbi:hypothetical protein P9112_002607 [Eukaryota sp. TZLM1-RC]